MSRYLRVLTLAALTPLLMGHGGGSNPPAAGAKIGGTPITATVVMDPHATKGDLTPGADPKPKQDVTPTAKWGAIVVEHGGKTASAQFKIPQAFALFRGCDLNMTVLRFVYRQQKGNKLTDWIDKDTVSNLFGRLGFAVTDTNIPVITDIVWQQCLPEPSDNKLGQGQEQMDGGDGETQRAGYLTFRAIIQFLAP